MAADKELDGLAQTRFGGFFYARANVPALHITVRLADDFDGASPVAGKLDCCRSYCLYNHSNQISSSNGISSARAVHSTDSNPSPGQGWPDR
jgi:hypothetical protein